MSSQVKDSLSQELTQKKIRVQIRGLWKVFSSEEGPELPLKLQGLSKAEAQERFNAVVALQDVNFDVYEGETFVVMGLSGSGKSTLVRCLNRLIEPTSGSVLIDDEDILQYSEEQLIQFRRLKASMVFQHFGLLPHRNVLQNAAWGLEVQDMAVTEREARAKGILESVGLETWLDYKPSALSGGMQQRVGLARAVVANPEILLMDEPFSALDPLIRRDMQNELVKLQEQVKKTTIFITHDLAEAIKLGSRIAIMRDGAIIQLGTPEEIVADPVDDFVADFTRDVRPSSVLSVGYLVQTGRAEIQNGPINESSVQVNIAQSVDDAILASMDNPGPLTLADHSGKTLGMIEREDLLKTAFTPNLNPTSSNSNSTLTLNGNDPIAPNSQTMNLTRPAESEDLKQKGLVGSFLATFGPLLLVSAALTLLTLAIGLIWGLNVGFPADFGKGISEWVNDGIRSLTRNGAPVFDLIAGITIRFLLLLENFFLWLPWGTVVLGIGFLAWKTVTWKLGLFAIGSFGAVGLVGLWDSAMETVALIVVAVVFSIAIAIPLGILAARSNIVDSFLRPLLDGMQTMPAFVYLVPGIMLFGIGNVPAIFATLIYACPPAIRLTNLGIRSVTPQVVEAALSFGTTRRQLLFKVQLPMAIPTIMAGVNQTIMMALAMVVVASLVGAGGLGEDVLRALSRFKPGEALLGGLAIVALAIIVDRITQAWASERKNALQAEKE